MALSTHPQTSQDLTLPAGMDALAPGTADRAKALENASIERERLLHILTNGVGWAIMYIDPQLNLNFANQRFADWVGRDRREITGKNLADTFSSEAVEFYKPYVMRALQGESLTLETPSKAIVGVSRQLSISMFPDVDKNNAVIGAFFVARDIEDEHQLKQEIVDREHQLRLFTDNIPEAICYQDRERRYVFVNNTFLRALGLTREQVIGKTSLEVLGQEAFDLATPFVDRAMHGETVVYERLVQVLDQADEKTPRWIRIRTVPDFGEDGEVKGIYVVGVDIHDIKMAEQVLRGNEAELRAAIDSLPYPMAYVDTNFRYQFVNKQMEIVTGKTQSELVDKDMLQVFGPVRFAEVEPTWKRVLAGETITTERLIELAGGTQRWMSVRNSPRVDASGKVIGFYSAATDIDELKRTELELRHANWRTSSHFENTPLAIVEWDADFRVRRWSKQAERVFGWTEEEVIGKRFNEWQFVCDEETNQLALVGERINRAEEKHTTSLNRNYRKDGRLIWCDWYNSILRNEGGRIVSILSLAHDVTARVQAEERLIHQATHDGLTGLPNRMLLQERLQHALMRARRSGEKVAAMFIDLDRFKDVNDTLGHRIGDELLREIATRLSRLVRETDLLVRLSGDEFMVVLEGVTDIESLSTVASKLLVELRAPTQIEGHDIHISGSIGISVFPDDAEDVESLLKNADMAMYQAKAVGKNAYQRFSRDLAEQGSSMRMMENSLRAAVARDELVLFYQPKVDMKSQRILGAEALLRWKHPKRGLIPPGEFLHLADDAGLVHEIGDWVLETAFQQMRKWQDAGHNDIEVAINLSAGQFRATNLAETIIERIHRAGCNAKNVEVEVTETGMLRDPQGVGRTLSMLREHEVRVAIDDFGTGYSSLSHLKRFPIDTLKIDRSFVADLLTDRDDAAIVSAVLALARALDLNAVAEGVENEAQRLRLAEQGCNAFQGYLFSKALPAREFETMLRKQRTG